MDVTKISQLSDWVANPQFPLMFADMNGKKRLWACWVTDNVLYRADGFVPGKIKEPTALVFGGNSVKTPEEQALAEGEKRWIAQISKGYAPATDDAAGTEIYNFVEAQRAQNGGMNRGVKMWGETAITPETTSGTKDLSIVHYPMLAKKYKEFSGDDLELSSPGAAIKFPAFIQAKVDGLRALPRVDGDHVFLESRNGKDYVHLDHIRVAVKELLRKYPGTILDGELYVHKLYRTGDGHLTKEYSEEYTELSGVERFQFLSEACKITRTKSHQYEYLVEYWIFDIWGPESSFKDRLEKLKKITGHLGPASPIKTVPTSVVNSHEEIEEGMAELVGERSGRSGYEFEGIMVRQSASKYVSRNNYHCNELLKYKRFEDEEWTVTGAEACAGSHDGAIKWICEKEVNGTVQTVTAKQMGTVEESKKLYTRFLKNKEKYIGKMINIRFNDRTKDGVPRFPRATVFPTDKM